MKFSALLRITLALLTGAISLPAAEDSLKSRYHDRGHEYSPNADYIPH